MVLAGQYGFHILLVDEGVESITKGTAFTVSFSV